MWTAEGNAWISGRDLRISTAAPSWVGRIREAQAERARALALEQPT
ncbi:hypothetical protein AB0L88_41705 [Saccharopolyspora shandongensis]